jgi:hypothetical protein
VTDEAPAAPGAQDPFRDAAADLWRAGGGVGRLRVAGGSMGPTLTAGDVVRVRAGARPRLGDIVVARTAGGLVVHRVIGHRDERVLLRGDDTARADPPVAITDVLGRVTAVEGLPGRRLDSAMARSVGVAASTWARTQQALGDRPYRPRPGALPAMVDRVAARVAPPMPPEALLTLLAARLVIGSAEARRMAALAAAGLDWEQVLALARRAQLGPLVAHGLRQLGQDAAVPEAVRRDLQKQYLGNVLRHRQIVAIVDALLARLAGEDIPVLAHKGIALALTVYPDPALRIAGDLDLSVRDSDRARAEAAVADIRDGLVQANPDRRSQHGHHVELDGTAHHDLDPTRHGGGRWRAESLDWAGMWDRAETVVVGDHSLLVPCPTDLLVTLVANSVRRGFSPVRLIADIAAVVARHGDDIDWVALEHELARTRLDRRSWPALTYAVDWFGADVPARLLEPPADLHLAPWEILLLERKHRQPFLRLPTRVLWAGSAPAAVRQAWRLARAGRR